MKVAVLRTRASVHDMTSLLSISGLESQKVSYGLRISRLSKDLYELLTELDLNDVALPAGRAIFAPPFHPRLPSCFS